jgi:hypothetical protein
MEGGGWKCERSQGSSKLLSVNGAGAAEESRLGKTVTTTNPAERAPGECTCAPERAVATVLTAQARHAKSWTNFFAISAQIRRGVQQTAAGTMPARECPPHSGAPRPCRRAARVPVWSKPTRRPHVVVGARATTRRRPRTRAPRTIPIWRGRRRPRPRLFALLDLLQRFPGLFEIYVLEQLDPTARASLARTGSAFWDVVFPRSIFPVSLRARGRRRVGPRVFKLVDFLAIAHRLAWAKANGCPWVAQTCEIAARGGHLAGLQWAREHGCPWDSGTCDLAAQGGHLEVLRWAREQDCPWDEWTCYGAAAGGHLEVLRWARENDCPWDAWTCEGVAAGGHLEVLQWARAHGCPWRKHQCDAASSGVAARNHPETHAWVQRQPE